MSYCRLVHRTLSHYSYTNTVHFQARVELNQVTPRMSTAVLPLRERLCAFDLEALTVLSIQGGVKRIQIRALVPFYSCTARVIYSQPINKPHLSCSLDLS